MMSTSAADARNPNNDPNCAIWYGNSTSTYRTIGT